MYLCAKNLGPNPIMIPHGGEEEELYLPPYGLVWLSKPEEWDLSSPDARNLSRLVEEGKVELVERDSAPRSFVMPSTTKNPTLSKKDLGIVREILFNPDDSSALTLINLDPKMKVGARGTDKEYVKKKLLPCLGLAAEAYKTYEGHIDFPGADKRLRAINKRLKAGE